MKSSSKGSSYERAICKQLSEWWTAGERDDVFWRSSGSGARAKVRGRSGRNTAGQHGDVAATDPIGEPLIKAFTIEIKRGYSGASVQDLIDGNPDKSVWGKFLEQTIESYVQAGSWSWLLITKRDRREPLVVVQYKDMWLLHQKKPPCGFCNVKAILNTGELDLMVLPLEVFLDTVKPRQIVERMQNYGYTGSK